MNTLDGVTKVHRGRIQALLHAGDVAVVMQAIELGRTLGASLADLLSLVLWNHQPARLFSLVVDDSSEQFVELLRFCLWHLRPSVSACARPVRKVIEETIRAAESVHPRDVTPQVVAELEAIAQRAVNAVNDRPHHNKSVYTAYRAANLADLSVCDLKSSGQVYFERMADHVADISRDPVFVDAEEMEQYLIGRAVKSAGSRGLWQ